MGRNIQTETMQHVKKTRETPHSLLLKAASMWSNRFSKVSMFIATKFMNRIPVESGQLTSYLRQDVEWLEGSTGNSQELRILISLQTISFVSQTLIERMDQCAFLLNIFLSWGFFLLPRKRGRTLGTRLYWWIIRELTIRQRATPMKMSLKNWLHVLWIFFAVIPSQPVTWWLELKRGICVRDQRGIVVYHLAFPVLKSTKNLVISSRRSCAGTAKKCTNSVMQALSCCLAHKIYCVFWRSRCHKYRQNKDLKNYASGKSFRLALFDVSFAP